MAQFADGCYLCQVRSWQGSAGRSMRNVARTSGSALDGSVSRCDGRLAALTALLSVQFAWSVALSVDVSGLSHVAFWLVPVVLVLDVMIAGLFVMERRDKLHRSVVSHFEEAEAELAAAKILATGVAGLRSKIPGGTTT